MGTEHGHAARLCSMDMHRMDMQHEGMNMDMQHGHENAAQIWAYSALAILFSDKIGEKR
jgi:hypothetical protein